MQFSEQLRKRRQDLGLRQEDVAKGAGISYITYGDYERGKCFPKETTLRMLCDVLKLNYDDMYAAMVESKRLGDIARAEQRAKASERIIGKNRWKQKVSAARVEQRKALHLELQLPPLAITGHLSEDGTVHGQLQAADVRLSLGEGWESAIVAQAPAGRSAEYQLLCHLAKQAQDGRGQIVSLVGVAGIGKSYLLSAVHKYLENQKFTVVVASCRENVDDIPYYPFAVLLNALSEDKPLADKWDAELPLLRRLLPSKLQTNKMELWQYSLLTEEEKLTKEQRHQMLINNLLRALAIAAQRRPLAIIIEDAHWIDKPSKKLMRVLARRLNAHRIYLLLAYRPQLKAPWVYVPNHTQLWLSPLREEHLEKALAEQLEPGQLAPEERDWIYRKTGGNPFYAKELVRELIDSDLLVRRTRWWKFRKPEALLEEVAKELEQVLFHRISRVPKSSQPLLRYAATLGSPFSKEQARIAVGKSLDASLQVLEKADIVHYESKEGIYHFIHDLTQEAAYNIIPETERAHWHRRVAETLESTSEMMDLETYLKLADHYMNAGEMTKTAECLLKAATEACKYMLYSEAQSYLQKALELLDERSNPTILRLRLDVLEQLDIVAGDIGNRRRRIDYIEEALHISKQIKTSPQRRASLYHRLADVYSNLRDNTESIYVAKEGLALLDSEPPCLEALHLWHTLAGAYRNEGMKAEMWEALKQELKIAESEGNLDWLTIAIKQHAGILRMEGDIHQAIERYMHAYDLTLKEDNAYEQCHIATELANCWESIGELEKAFEWYERGLTIAEQIYHWDILLNNSYKLALLALRVGMNQEAAEQQLIRAVELTGKMGFVQRQGQANAYLGRFYCHQERWDKARQRLEEAVAQLLDMKDSNDLVNALGFLEWSLEKLSEQAAFPPLCNKLQQHVHPNIKIPKQWRLTPASPISNLADEVFIDRFDGGKLAQRWRFQTGRDDAYYKLCEEGGIILHAPYGCDLYPQVNLDAPRLVVELSGDFAVEVEIENLPEEPIQVGGILLWQDDHHFFRFERGTFGPNELRFGYVVGEEKAVMTRLGRGFLNAKSYRLRLERIGIRVRALVSRDNKQWLSCGEYETSLRDPLSVGFYALCPEVLTEFYPIDVTQSRLWVKAFRIIAPM